MTLEVSLGHESCMKGFTKVGTPQTTKYLIPTPIFSPCVNTAMSHKRQTCMQVSKVYYVNLSLKVSSLVMCVLSLLSLIGAYDLKLCKIIRKSLLIQ